VPGLAQVANKRNGIDVDKFDYLERDSMMCGVGVPLDAKRLMLFSRISPDRAQVSQRGGVYG
jgi:HD superfamily phosphohydrolase